MTFSEIQHTTAEQSKDNFENIRDELKTTLSTLADDIFDSPEDFVFGKELSSDEADDIDNGHRQRISRYLTESGAGTINVSRVIATEPQSVDPTKEWKSYIVYFDLGLDRYEFSMAEMRKQFILAQHTDYKDGQRTAVDISNDSDALLEAEVALELLREAITKKE